MPSRYPANAVIAVLGSEGLQPEPIGRRLERHLEVIGDVEDRHDTIGVPTRIIWS